MLASTPYTRHTPVVLRDGRPTHQRFTPEQLEALQCLPAGYTAKAGSERRRGELVGDGMTVCVIMDLLRGAVGA